MFGVNRRLLKERMCVGRRVMISLRRGDKSPGDQDSRQGWKEQNGWRQPQRARHRRKKKKTQKLGFT